MYFEIGFQGSYCAALCAPPHLSIYNELLYKNFVEKLLKISCIVKNTIHIDVNNCV